MEGDNPILLIYASLPRRYEGEATSYTPQKSHAQVPHETKGFSQQGLVRPLTVHLIGSKTLFSP